MRDVYIAAAAVEPFGKHPDRNAGELGQAALRRLFASIDLDPGRVDIGFGGSTFGGSLLTQRAMQGVGISGPPMFTIENACASGGSAVNLAFSAVAAGSSDCAIAFGAENLSSLGGGALPLSAKDIEADLGMVMPAAYAMRAQRYLSDFGAKSDVLDAVTEKNRANGAHNPRAHFQKTVTVDEVRASRSVADPLRLLHCCPNTDGAAALLIGTRELIEELGQPAVRIVASITRSGQFNNGYRDMTWPDITARSATAAYAMAGIQPGDVDFAELHDAFSISELLHAEALGFADRGDAHRRTLNGDFHRGGPLPLNPSGGLLSRGHPVGATGVTQICESYWQLVGESEPELQLGSVRTALTHVTGGGIFGVDNGACSIHILRSE